MNKYFYENEALDTKLCFLRFMKQIWKVITATVLLAILFGLCYILAHTVFGPAREYRVIDEYYVDYAVDENGVEQVCFNYATWQDLADTDYFMDYILPKLSFEIDRAELENYVDATLLSDTRIVTATVTTDHPEKTMEIQKYFVEAFLQFDKEYEEIAAISRIKTGEKASLVAFDDRTGSAILLGAMIGFIVSGFLLYLMVILDDSVYLPITLEKRCKIPTEIYGGNNAFDGTEGIITEDGQTILWVLAGAHNGTRIEKLVSEVAKNNKQITKAYLVGMDEKLYKAYYATKYFTFKKEQ